MKVAILVKITLAILLAVAMVEGIVGCASSGPVEWNSFIDPGEPHLQGMAAAQDLTLPTKPEIWVIERGGNDKINVTNGTIDYARAGNELRVIAPREDAPQDLPLQHMDVRACIDGYIACTDVSQRFENPLDRAVAARYEFRLPEGAAVSDFVMTIGQRQIRAIIREKADAAKIYREAVRQGYQASLISQNAAGILTQDIGPLQPGKPIDVNFHYCNPLQYQHGGWQYTFPMVGMETKNVSLDIHLDGGMALGQIESPTHEVVVDKKSGQSVEVKLAAGQDVSRKDFLLRFGEVTGEMGATMLTQKGVDGNYFTLMLNPPAVDQPGGAIDLTVVMDMRRKMPADRARKFTSAALDCLGPEDGVRIIVVGDQAWVPWNSHGTNSLPDGFLWKLGAGGDCPMESGLELACKNANEAGKRQVVMVVTDGRTMDASCFEAARKLGNMSRVVICLVDPGVNAGYAQALARCSGGVVARVGEDNDITGLKQWIGQAREAGIEGVTIDFGTARVSDLLPATMAVGMGRPMIISGRYSGELPGEIHVSGMAAGKARVWTVRPRKIDANCGNAIETIWAKMKITALADRYLETSNESLVEQMKQTGLEHSVVSPVTWLMMVDASGPVGLK